MIDKADKEETRYSNLRKRIEDNPVVAVLLILAFVVGGIAAVTRNLGEIANLFSAKEFPVGTPEQPIRLDPSEIRKLIVDKVEKGKLVEPTHPEFEGRPNTWYKAFYFKDGRMLYLRAVTRSLPDNWEWYVDQNGNLCRGPVNSDSRPCRSIESIRKGYYRARGNRTGTVRYEFYVEEPQPHDFQENR